MRPLEPAPLPESASPARGPSPGQVVLGLVLVVAGVAWLLEVVADVDIRWDVLAALALLLVGGGLIAGARTGAHAGLVAVGVLLTLVLALGSSVGALGDIPFSGGIGQRVERPATLAEDVTHRLAIGELEIDLTAAELAASGTVRVTASVALGRLVVRAPADAGLRVEAAAGAGSIKVLGEVAEGFDVDLAVTADGSPVIELDLKIGLGELVVQR